MCAGKTPDAGKFFISSMHLHLWKQGLPAKIPCPPCPIELFLSKEFSRSNRLDIAYAIRKSEFQIFRNLCFDMIVAQTGSVLQGVCETKFLFFNSML